MSDRERFWAWTLAAIVIVGVILDAVVNRGGKIMP